MARGFLGGAIWGVVISGVGAGALSVAMGPADRDRFAAVGQDNIPLVAEDLVQAPEPSQIPEMPVEPETPKASTVPSEPDAEPISEPEPEPEPEREPEPEPETSAAEPAIDPAKPGRRPNPETAFETPQAPGGALDAPQAPFAVGADTALPVPPTVGGAPVAPAGAEPSSEGAQVTVATDAPVLPAAQSAVPGAPEPETSLDISTEPAQPPLPAISAEETALITEEAPIPDNALVALIPQEAEEEPVRQETAVVPEPVPAPQPAPIAIVQPTPEADPDRPAIGKPAGSLLDRTQAVPASRLPRLGSEADQPLESAELSGTPLVQFAVKPNPVPAADVPRISIILIDDAVDTWGPEAIKTLPIPVSIAIPPSHPEAAKTAAEYRQLGFEVLAMADIPLGATPSDVEVTLSGTLQAVPGAVAVLEDPDGGLQSSRDVSSQTATFLAASGHGLVMMPKGLNTAQQLALKAGVPSASLFRDMDNDNQDASAVRRALDQATFRAKQEGAVVMLGRLTANTLSGVIQWGLQDKNASIAIVPVSTILQEAVAQ
ncbi:divergent polysaccharide deacetylase family protein [Pelagimonas varians]|uniref:divergent polysaccharide deacetylase family protein n=1 Tax=Pelagimonas varians TaxID=696760 RepID=UPI000D84FFE0|nr:divergent polysaccharide deacetylase family protein [Pelagimonas varians]PYG34421.1 polysaccharide deacetylase 2 family uncharacterized protein YibQ [Pelagimonas varians]